MPEVLSSSITDGAITLSVGDAIAMGLIVTRVLAMFMIAPVFRSQVFPMRFRIVLALLIAVLIVPSALGNGSPDDSFRGSLEPVRIAFLFVGEFAIGLVFGLSLTLLFNAVDLAGRQIAGMCGSQFPGLPDEMSGSGGSPIAKLYGALCLLVFLCIGGHRLAMSGLLDSFQQARIGHDHLAADFLPLVTGLLAHSFEFAIRLGAPIVLASLLAMLLLGIASRGLPNFNLMQSTFTINSLLSLLLMIGCIGSLHALFESQHSVIQERISAWLEEQDEIAAGDCPHDFLASGLPPRHK